MPVITSTPSGTDALCRLFVGADRIWLPSDICSSVTDGCAVSGIRVSHYPVIRAWETDGDRYDFSDVDDCELVVVSDLFNFRSIHLPSCSGMKIVLDLAHCSFATAAYYLEKILEESVDIQLVGIVFSFGRGKFLRKGGGGCLVTGVEKANLDQILSIQAKLESEFGTVGPYQDCDLREKFAVQEVRTNATSTRMVVRPEDFVSAQEKIEELRKIWKLDISDGIYDHLSEKRVSEFYVWKRT